MVATFIGIDPGQKGGVVAIRDGVGVYSGVMPVLGGEVDCGLLSHYLRCVVRDNLGPPVVAVIEKVHAMPKQGVSSTFKFGRNYGRAEGVLLAMGISLQHVTPQAWKKVILAGTAKDKGAAILHCRHRWPELDLTPGRLRVPHDGIADACCLAEYGMIMGAKL